MMSGSRTLTGVRLTKFTHSCVRLDAPGRALVIDPGVFSETESALSGVDAVLVTHEHPDHIDAGAIRAAAGRSPDLRVWCPAPVAEQLSDLGDRVTTLEPGERVDVAGFQVRTFGGQHALIHPSIPVVANLAYLVDDAVYHPGDSFAVPEVEVEMLLLPIHAPWSKAAEVLDFMISVRASVVHQIHDGLLNQRGLDVVEGHVERVARRYGSRFEHLASGDSVEL